MKIKTYSKTSTIRFYEDDKLVVVAFVPKKGNISTYIHKDLNDLVKDLEGVHLKPDYEKNPDDYEYRKMLAPVDKQTPLQTLKAFVKTFIPDAQFVALQELPKRAPKKPEAKTEVKVEEKA